MKMKMKMKHNVVLKEITDELELLLITGGSDKQGSGGSGDWATGAQAIWGTVVGTISNKSCSYPGGFYGSSNATPTGSGTCTGGMMAQGKGK